MITLTKEQFVDFSIGKKSTQGLTNNFIATYVDSNKDYTVRTVSASNSASIKQGGQIKQKSFDFTAFHTTDIVYKQLYKALKKYSFPHSALSFSVARTVGNDINIGDLVTINNDDFSINSEFRITKKTDKEIDKNIISFEAEQYTTNLFDSTYVDSGGGSWVEPSIDLVPFTHYRVVELPYNSDYGFNPAYMILVQRELGIETGFQVYMSTNGTDYEALATLYSFSQYGTLSADYPITYDFDKTTGLTFTPYKDDLTWNSISKDDLFRVTRFALVNDEVLAFQNYTPSGSSGIVLQNIIRGVGYSEIASHTSGDDIWIVNYGISNIVQTDRSSDFYIKIVPIFQSTVGDLASATAIHITPQFRAKTPYKPARIEAARSGANVHIKIYPILKMFDGAGKLAENSYNDVYPFNYYGNIRYSVDGGATWVDMGNVSEFDLNNANQFTLNVEQMQFNFISSPISVLVNTDDGTYVGR